MITLVEESYAGKKRFAGLNFLIEGRMFYRPRASESNQEELALVLSEALDKINYYGPMLSFDCKKNTIVSQGRLARLSASEQSTIFAPPVGRSGGLLFRDSIASDYVVEVTTLHSEYAKDFVKGGDMQSIWLGIGELHIGAQPTSDLSIIDLFKGCEWLIVAGPFYDEQEISVVVSQNIKAV